MAESLKAKTIKGTIWSSLERFSAQGIQFIVMIIMARILTPNDYGLVGMLAIFIGISQSLIDSGFSQALIRKQDRSEIDQSTVFFFNVAIAIILYVILYAVAPLIAEFYNEPVLVNLTRVVCLSIVINSLVVVQRAMFTVNIDFKTQAKASVTAAIVSGIAGIYMAYTGYGVWAIVVQQLTNYGCNAILLWVLSSWRPIRAYSWSSFRELFSFGSRLALSGIIDTLYRNLYLLVIGKIFKASDLGYYTRAHQFSDFPSSNITGIIQRVTYPVLCKIQNDDERLTNAYRRLLRFSAFIIFPLMTGLAGVAIPFIDVVLTEKWNFAGILLQIICFQMMWFPIHAINLNLLMVKGQSQIFLRLEIIKKIVAVCVVAVTAPFGLIVMCYGAIVNSLIALAINTHYTGKLLDLGFFKQMRDLLPALSYSISMFVVVLIVVHFIPEKLLALIVGITVGLGYFIAVAFITKSRDLRELIAIVKRK